LLSGPTDQRMNIGVQASHECFLGYVKYKTKTI